MQGEGADVEGGADDGALDAFAGQLGDGSEVVEGRDPAGRHDRLGRPRADVTEQVEVGALEHAVLGDVGDDVPRAPVAVEPLEDLPEVAAVLGPAAGGEGGAAYVEPDGDAVAVRRDRLGAPLGVLQGGRPDVDAAAAGGHRRLRGTRRRGCRRTSRRRRRADRRSRRAARGWTPGRTPRRGRPGGPTRRRRPAS